MKKELGFTTIEKIKEANYQRRVDFGSYDKTNAIKDRETLISPYDFLEGNSDYLDSSYRFIDNEKELDELMNDYDMNDGKGDNTYNYSGYLSNELNFYSFKSLYDDRVLVAYSIHIGLDVRAGYTDSVWIEYDSEYDFLYHLSQRFVLGEFEIGDYSVSVYGEAVNEIADISYMNNDNCDSDTIESWVDAYDLNDLKESVIEALKEHDVL